ncbi:MAG: hypothetical protein ACR2FO_00715 [Actinomycetota bacterium]
MSIVLRAILFVLGAAVALMVYGSAIRTVILPRGVPAKLSRWVMLITRMALGLRLGRRADYEKRDRVMALYGPLGLMNLLAAWLGLVMAGYTLMFWAIENGALKDAFAISGSSLLTLGFAGAKNTAELALSFTEAATGLVLLALLITYLPSIYGAFSRRELEVAKLEVRAGAPPTGLEMLERAWRLQRLDRLTDVWIAWEAWFADVEESHTSLPVLVFFRSPQPDRSWVTAAGAVLDAASLLASTVDQPRNIESELCVRAGYVSLRKIAEFFQIPFNPNPHPKDPISIQRQEFDDVYNRLGEAGLPLKDREQAWEGFSGWRVNYDAVLLALATLTLAPYAPWSSDRSLKFRYPGAWSGINAWRRSRKPSTAIPAQGEK